MEHFESWASIFKCILLRRNDSIPVHISLTFVENSLIENMSILLQGMVWLRARSNRLPEPTMTQLADACMAKHQLSCLLYSARIVGHIEYFNVLI